ncbi:hypothetical protein ABK040_012037 [Willaertia magna]
MEKESNLREQSTLSGGQDFRVFNQDVKTLDTGRASVGQGLQSKGAFQGDSEWHQVEQGGKASDKPLTSQELENMDKQESSQK